MMNQLYYILALLPLLAGVSSLAAGTIDIVTLGAKNDGSEDVSAIVNANTAKGDLFFPSGVYKVSHPLVLKNSIRGEGYSRVPRVGAVGTWLVSDIAATNATHGVVEFGDVAVNVENLNIKCFSRECGIRIHTKGWNTLTFIDKVGVFGVESYGLFAQGPGSRRVFAENMTIWGTSRDPDSRSVGIRIAGFVDCRISNIEIMGVCRGIELFNEHTYGDNLHVWTGIDGKFGGEWWHDTRSIVLGERAHFSGSQIYPDTSYYAFDLGANSLCEIANVMYWEDDSVKKVQDRTGRFVHHADASRPGCLSVTGGLVGAGGDDKTPGATATYYASEATFRDVSLLSNYAIKGANIDRLCLGRNHGCGLLLRLLFLWRLLFLRLFLLLAVLHPLDYELCHDIREKHCNCHGEDDQRDNHKLIRRGNRFLVGDYLLICGVDRELDLLEEADTAYRVVKLALFN